MKTSVTRGEPYFSMYECTKFEDSRYIFLFAHTVVASEKRFERDDLIVHKEELLFLW